MHKLVNNLAWTVIVLTIAGVLIGIAWLRERFASDGR